MTPETLGDPQLLAALRDLWERSDPPPADLDALALEAIERAELDGDLVVLELLAEELAFENVRGDGERTLRFASDGYEVLLRITREPEGFRIDGWSAPATAGVVRIEVDGRERSVDSDAFGRFAFVGVRPGTATVWLAETSDGPTVWTTAAFTL